MVHAIRLGHALAAALAGSVLLLLVSGFGIGMAIQQRILAPRTLDVHLGAVEVVAYTSRRADCEPWYITPCQPEVIAAGEPGFYVIWLVTRTNPLDAAAMWPMATRLVTLPLDP